VNWLLPAVIIIGGSYALYYVMYVWKRCAWGRHEWSMFRGFEGVDPHVDSYCLKCQIKYIETPEGRARYGEKM
jgi:hypothetical protein